MFGCTKPTGEITAVARTPPCRHHLGLGIYNVQVAVEGMDGNKKNHLLHLCGQLLRLVLIPFHIDSESHAWARTTALSFAAELDGHVLGTLCAVTMALLTNRLDLCIQGHSERANPSPPLEGLISAQDNRTLQFAKSCIQRLHVRVEALANVLEQTLIAQQLQFMHTRTQHGSTSSSIFPLWSNPRDAPNEDEPGNTPNGPANKEVRTKTCNQQPDDAMP